MAEAPNALHWAAKGGSAEVLKALVDRGAHIDLPTLYKYDQPRIASWTRGSFQSDTPLHLAVKSYSVEVATLLISAGADVSAKNESGFTPLHFVLMSRSLGHRENGRLLESVKLLIKSGSDVNALTEVKQTPLLLAVDHRNGMPVPTVIELLLASGASVNVRNQSQDTPLHVLLDHRKQQEDSTVAVARLLIGAGVDVNAQNVLGKTPLDLEAWHKLDYVRKLLVAHGARSGK